MSDDKNYDPLYRLRHSASHILAQAVLDLFPGTKLAIGPVIAEGFYYDLDCPQTFQEEDLSRLEKRMQEIIDAKQEFRQTCMPKSEARKYFQDRREPYKLEIIEGIPGEAVNFVQNGNFIDLCEGGHVRNSEEIKAFKLLSVAGAYWRGNEHNPMLQRIYGTAFASVKELDEFLKRREEALKRDHRKLGKQLDLFSFHQEAPGMPFYHPNGKIIYDELVKFWMAEHRKEGYLEVKTPVLLKDNLWRQSGHYEHYQENMFFSKKDDDQYAIKPMNCPGHTLIYGNTQRSYRELPLRLAELGMVHRHERSGVLHGLFRVNAFTIDDAHIFCTEDQIESEITRCIALILKIYRTFGFEKIQVYLSTKPKDSMGSAEIWQKAEAALQQALTHNKISFELNAGGGAFYGPKIDFEITDSIGRSWQCGTIQLDFQMPMRFGLTYVSADNQPVQPVMVHRAVFGSIERFYGILVEHFAGAFPLWLAPVQVRLATIADRHIPYTEKLLEQLKSEGVRADADLRTEKIGYKIREAEMLKIPYVFVVGDKEMEAGRVAVRMRGRQDLGVQEPGAMIQRIQQEVIQKT